ncbi:hypothetical protein N7478_007712 [Penicillium angulare]|uniref:uncharacterized protein n=1 Tax=Penicillium angulare TaxID=116970 RepID=UPI0025417FD2|nr:uncharacterized protein N7478_007712 [Penicillium angulare]KAJ5272587.1 hypothetical protein N7478_007712 [Penicillium angulare]
MDDTLPDHTSITVPVPVAEITSEERFKAIPVAEITHFVVQLSAKRMNSIMQSVVGIPYDHNKPWPYWFFIGKIVSKTFLNNEEQLEWLKFVHVHDREFIGFINTQINRVSNQEDAKAEEVYLQVVEINFLKP